MIDFIAIVIIIVNVETRCLIPLSEKKCQSAPPGYQQIKRVSSFFILRSHS